MEIINRIIRAMKLDSNLYEEVEADKSAIKQATLIVVLSSLASGISLATNAGLIGVVTGTIVALISWYIWAYIVYFIGTKFLPEADTESDHGELLRTLGFASSPGLIRVLGVIPGFIGIIQLVASIWMLVAMVIAVRQALDYKSTGRAILVCFIGWVVQAIIIVLFFWLTGFSIN